MAIDYTKRPAAGEPTQPAQPTQPTQPTPPTPSTVSLSKVTLTKASPTVSLTKQSSGLLRVNLNWNARPEGSGGGGGMFKRPTAAIDLDLGCLYEFTDGTKGVVQALGNAFTAMPKGSSARVIWLDGDDRSGATSGGENLFIDLAFAAQIRRVMVFALIYEGVANWAAADAVVTLFPASGSEIEVRLDEPRPKARICGIAMLEQSGGTLSVRREVNYIEGTQSTLDRAYGWGMNWSAGRK